MGDQFEIVVDTDVGDETAAVVASAIVRWLVGEGVVMAERSACVLGLDDLGHAPGPSAATAFSGESIGIRTLTSNGLELNIGREVFTACEGGTEPLGCPRCGAENSADDEWFEATDDWYDGGVGLMACAECAAVSPITAWKTEPYWAFGNLGFTFWNRPPLRPDFVQQISQQLNHRVKLVVGSL